MSLLYVLLGFVLGIVVVCTIIVYQKDTESIKGKHGKS